jgi:hypothetical protein
MVAGMDKVLAKSMDWDTAKNRLQVEQKVIEDHTLPLSAWESAIEGSRFGLRLKSTGRFYEATPWAMKKMVGVGAGGREFDYLFEDARHATSVDKVTGEKKVLFARDAPGT